VHNRCDDLGGHSRRARGSDYRQPELVGDWVVMVLYGQSSVLSSLLEINPPTAYEASMPLPRAQLLPRLLCTPPACPRRWLLSRCYRNIRDLPAFCLTSMAALTGSAMIVLAMFASAARILDNAHPRRPVAPLVLSMSFLSFQY